MRKAQLGRTGAEVGVMCLGAMRFGTLNDHGSSAQLLDMFVEAGGNFIDTANCYSRWYPGGKGGDSEQMLGRWMRERGNRGKLFIATKVGVEYQDVPYGLTADIIARECDRSLQRLGIDTIDLYYAHMDDCDTPLGETMEAFDKLIQAGKARFIGASNYSAWRLADAEAVARANGWTPFCCIQQRHTYLRPKPGASFGRQVVATQDLLDFCAVRGMTLLPYTPLLEGAYVRDDKPIREQYIGPDADERMAVLGTVVKETGATANQVVLAWMMQQKLSVVPVFSARNAEQMREDLGALDVQLTHDQVDRLNEASA